MDDIQLCKPRTLSHTSMLKKFPKLFKGTDLRFSDAAGQRSKSLMKLRPVRVLEVTQGVSSESQLSIHDFKAAYNPRCRIYTNPAIGVVKLPKTGFQLAEGAELGSIFASKSQKLVKPAMQSIEHLNCFRLLKEAIAPYNRVKPNYRQCLKRSLKELKNLNVTSADSLRLEHIICKKPYDKPYAHEFIKACKDGNASEVERLISRSRFIVHVIDSMEMTGLHWAVLRRHEKVVRLLLKRKAYVDAIDLVFAKQSHRTPLHIAARLNFEDIVQMLLDAKADPYIKTTSQKIASRLTTDYSIRTMLQNAMLVRST